MENKRKKQVETVIIIFTILSVIILYRVINSEIIQADTLWHIKNGEWIIKNKTIPNIDYFSIHSNLNFMAHEWLFDVLYYVINVLAGIKGIYLITMLFNVIGIIYVTIKSQYKMYAINIILLMTISGFYKPIMAIPDTIGILFLIFICKNITNKDISIKKKIITNSILCILLVNFHGGMMSACIIQIVFVKTMEIIATKDKKIVKESLALFFDTIICGLFNPYFIKIYLYGIMVNTEASKFIVDWNYFSFYKLSTIFVMIILIGLCVYGMTRIQVNKTDLIVMFFYLVMLLRFNRTINAFSYIFILYGTKYIVAAIEKYKDKIPIYIKKMCVGIETILIILISIFSITYIKQNYSNEKSLDEYIEMKYINTENINRLKGKKVFNDYNLGGLLIYKDINVFIDGRVDPYVPEYNNPDIFSDYISAMYNTNKMDVLVSVYGINTLVLNPNSVSAQIYKESCKWIVTYETKNILILERK